jgi:hypothetical protein
MIACPEQDDRSCVFPADMRRLIRHIGEVLSQWGLSLK